MVADSDEEMVRRCTSFPLRLLSLSSTQPLCPADKGIPGRCMGPQAVIVSSMGIVIIVRNGKWDGVIKYM